MRMIIGGLLAAALSATLTAGSATGMSDGDRQRLLAHLDMTEGWLVSEVTGLSQPQLTYRMSPDSWNVMEVAEHLAVAEGRSWTNLQDSMKQPADTTKPEATDAAILWYGIDRTNRQKTGEARVPTGRWPTVQGSLEEFRKRRAAMRAYATSTQEDLRGHRLIDGNMDVYQWFLMISTHSQRHILQIREIKAHAGYPSS